MKLYTKRGDMGETDLFGGQRRGKDALRIEAYGCVDELSAFLGHAAAACEHQAMRQQLAELQSRLFDLGADLASPHEPGKEEKPGVIPRIAPEHVAQLERQIDAACRNLPAMKSFILPGGTELASRLHVARGVCRRAERRCVALARQEEVGEAVVIFLNRLSDLLFALAREANRLAGVEDVPWISPRQQGGQGPGRR
ncbi:MAG: cob(I)yrinic acid a,c-diamide adenosyltransferase [Phycisphaeraceae bacterium]